VNQVRPIWGRQVRFAAAHWGRATIGGGSR
jgi:hypothetical protein